MKKTAAKTTTKGKATRGRKRSAPHVYREPKTAGELNLDCAVCHAPAEWFDYGRGSKDHRAGFVCSAEPVIGRREKLLIREPPIAH